MINWLKKTADDVSTLAKNAMNTPAPIGKTVVGVLIIESIVIGTFLATTHKVKVNILFG